MKKRMFALENEMKKRIFAFIAPDDDSIVFMSTVIEDTPTPVIVTNIEDLKSMSPYAQEMANDLQKTVDIVELGFVGKVGEINPSSQNALEVNLLDEKTTTN